VLSRLSREITQQRSFFPGIKGPRLGADCHSSPSIFEVKNEWSYTLTSPYAFMAYTGKS
jgi:hypothetical protein